MKPLIALITAALLTSQASASVLLEDFSDFANWESNWFGAQSNAKNYIQVQGLEGYIPLRNNNPDGLWLDDNDGTASDSNVTIRFNDPFAASISLLSLDLASHISSLEIVFFDALGNNLSSQAVTPTYGALGLPGIYQNFTVSSATGIGGFSLLSSSGIEGDLSLDNLIAIVSDTSVSVPEPGSLLLLGLGALGLMAQRRRLA
ncbi:MAG: hypothetical protein RL497_3160 [Pseudomonadota bacterium]|jgi:hypothetical protein